MFRRLKREFRLITDNIPLILLAAFLCSICGVLLWVSGGSTWYAIRKASDPWMTISLSGVFILWIIIYGLVGISMSLIWLTGKARACNSRSCLTAFALVCGAYLLMLSWYAVFFCTRLTLFAAVLLIISFGLCIAVHLIMRRYLRLISLVMLLIEAAIVYFLWFSFAAI